MRSTNGGPEFADDGLSSDEGEGEGESDSALEDEDFGNDIFQPATPPPTHQREHPPPLVPPEPRKDDSSDAQATPTAAATMKTPTATTPAPIASSRSQSFTKFLRRPASKRSSSLDSTMLKEAGLPSSPSTPTLPVSASQSQSGTLTPTSGTRRSSAHKAKFRKSWGAKGPAGFNFSAGPNDILGIVMLEIKGAKDLPKLRNSACFHSCSMFFDVT